MSRHASAAGTRSTLIVLHLCHCQEIPQSVLFCSLQWCLNCYSLPGSNCLTVACPCYRVMFCPNLWQSMFSGIYNIHACTSPSFICETFPQAEDIFLLSWLLLCRQDVSCQVGPVFVLISPFDTCPQGWPWSERGPANFAEVLVNDALW